MRCILRRVVVDNLDITYQSGANIGALNQVVRKQRIPWKAAFQYLVQDTDFINAFACKNSLAEKVLVNIGDSARVNVVARLAGVDRGQP